MFSANSWLHANDVKVIDEVRKLPLVFASG